MKEEIKEKIKWINCAKLCAIMAVLIDHSEIVLYDDLDIAVFTYFSVSMFVFISGMMCYSSNLRHQLSYTDTVKKKLKKVIPAYLVTVVMYELIIYKGYFDLRQYIIDTAGFNISAHFYYIALYIQLMLINVPLCRILEKIQDKIIYEIGLGIIIFIFSMYTSHYTNIFYIYGGGGKLLGGTYLFVFYIGMLIQKHDIFKKPDKIHGVIIAVISFFLLISWWKFQCVDKYAIDAKLHFSDGVNPPGISIFIMMCLMLCFCYGSFSTIEQTPLHCITDTASKLGQYTLYVFLYHRLILDHFLVPYINPANIWIKRSIYIAAMLSIPAMIECLTGRLLKNRNNS